MLRAKSYLKWLALKARRFGLQIYKSALLRYEYHLIKKANVEFMKYNWWKI